MTAAQYIDGRWLSGESAEQISVYDPSLGQPFAELMAASAAQVDQAAHHCTVAPHFLDRLQDFERLDLVARRSVVSDQLGLVLDAPGAVQQSVVVRDQASQLRAVAVNLRFVVVMDRFRQISR